jgi:hypothetical protein
MIHSGVTTGTPTKIPFGMGAYFSGVTYSEKVAPTEEEMKAAIIGATQDGGTFTIEPKFFDIPADGVDVPVAELKQKVGENAKMETSFIELTPELLAHQAIANIGESTDKKYAVLTSSTNLKAGHFYEGFGYVGNHIDGRDMIILFKKALCTSGASVESKTGQNSVFKGTFECHSDIEYGVKKLPYAIFIRKAEGWTPVDPDEVAAA